MLVAALIPSFILLLGATRAVPDAAALWSALWVCVAVRQHVLEQHKVDEVALDDALEGAVDEVVVTADWDGAASQNESRPFQANGPS